MKNRKAVIITAVVIAVVATIIISLPALLQAAGLHPHYAGASYQLSGKRALIVTTSHGTLGDSGKPTGVYASVCHGAFGVSLSDPSMMNVIRSFGGFYLGFAAFLILAERREGGADLAVFAAVLAMAGFLAGRAIGLFADGMPDRSVLVSSMVEIAFAVWGIIILARGTSHGQTQ